MRTLILTLQEGASGMDIKKGGALNAPIKNHLKALLAWFFLHRKGWCPADDKNAIETPFFAISSPQKSMGGIVIVIDISEWGRVDFEKGIE